MTTTPMWDFLYPETGGAPPVIDVLKARREWLKNALDMVESGSDIIGWTDASRNDRHYLRRQLTALDDHIAAVKHSNEKAQ